MACVGDRVTITVVAVPESGAKDIHNVCNECSFYALDSCAYIGCTHTEDMPDSADVIFVPEGVAESYIVRAVERRMEHDG